MINEESELHEEIKRQLAEAARGVNAAIPSQVDKTGLAEADEKIKSALRGLQQKLNQVG